MAQKTKGVTLWLALWSAAREVELVAQRQIAGSGLCLTDFAVLEFLLHQGAQRVNAIGERVMLTSGSVTTAVSRLVERGLVRRRPDEHDARGRLVELTDEGRAAIVAAFAGHAAALEEVFAALDDEQRGELLATLLKVRREARTQAGKR